jgi:hypothetical protein
MDGQLLSTEAQERLSALLTKAVDVLPYASDEACNQVFAILAQFCTNALAKKHARREAKFALMNVEDLIALAQDIAPNRQDEAKKRKQLDEGAEVCEKEEEGESSLAKKKKIAPKPAKSGGDNEIEGDESDGKLAEVQWEFSQAYNIVKVRTIDEEPFLIHLMARPPIAGNQKALAYFMRRDDFHSVNDQSGRNGSTLRKRLVAALSEYCETLNEIPQFLREELNTFEWSKSVVSSHNSSNE